MTRASSPQSAGSWCPMASMTMPSRKAHSPTVSESSPNRSMATMRTTDPAGTMSARLASSPASRARAEAGRASRRACTAASSGLATVSWLTDSGTGPVRAAAMRARSHRVPQGAGAVGDDLLGSGGFGQRLQMAYGSHGVFGRPFGDAPFPGHHVSQPQHLLLAHQWLEAVIRVSLADEQVERVAAEIEGS